MAMASNHLSPSVVDLRYERHLMVFHPALLAWSNFPVGEEVEWGGAVAWEEDVNVPTTRVFRGCVGVGASWSANCLVSTSRSA